MLTLLVAPGYAGPQRMALDATSDRPSYSSGELPQVMLILRNLDNKSVDVLPFAGAISALKAQRWDPLTTKWKSIIAVKTFGIAKCYDDEQTPELVALGPGQAVSFPFHTVADGTGVSWLLDGVEPQDGRSDIVFTLLVAKPGLVCAPTYYRFKGPGRFRVRFKYKLPGGRWLPNLFRASVTSNSLEFTLE